MATPVFCRDCTYRKDAWLCAIAERTFDIVTGEAIPRTCRDERVFGDGKCGPEGDHFVPKAKGAPTPPGTTV